MKKLMMCAMVAFAAFAAWADVITNTVVVVSNIYNNVYNVQTVTQRVQNTHFNYYFTNHETVVIHESHLISQTNKTVSLEVGNSYLIAASNQANRAAAAVGDARSFADASAGSASASASSAAASRSAAASECASALATINARINWFDQHSGETITQINYNTNIDIHVAQTIITNDFRHVPYDLDSNLEIDYNAFAMKAKGGTNCVYKITCPSGCAYDSGTSIGEGSFQMWFDRFELVNGKGKFWYKSNYDTGVPNNFSGRTWRFEWAYWYEGVWCVAIRQRRMSGGTVIENNLYEMTLTAGYPSASGKFNNRPSYMWAASNSTWGRMTTVSSSTAMGFVSSLEIRENVVHDLATLRESLTAMVQQSFDRLDALEDRVSGGEDSLSARIDTVSNAVDEISASVGELSDRMSAIESGSPHKYEHGGTTYNNVTVYSTPTDNGKVMLTPSSSSSYATASYLVTPNYRYPTTTASTWVFRPAYVDTDAFGLRIQYVCENITQISYSSSARTRMVVPEYLYWQNGYMYMKIKTFTDGVQDGSVVGRVADSSYPNSYSTAKTISKTSGENWSATSVATIKMNTQITPAGTAVWVPATPSAAITPIISWMVTGK